MEGQHSADGAYRRAGVDIDLAKDLLGQLKGKFAKARRPEMLAPVGGFGGLFALDFTKYREPVLVSSVDGVGTKLMVAAMAGEYGGVGHDIVNHCVNDIAVQGAEPIYFLDYLGIGKLRSPLYEQVLEGIIDACAAAGCALLGGETAEMPGMYGDDFDLVGSITGVVERGKLITGERIKPGHAAIALASNGLHTNGYSLARKILFEDAAVGIDERPSELGGESVGEALLKPHLCYWPAIKAALAAGIRIDGIAHITGGGLYDNIPRVLPEGVGVEINPKAMPTPPIMRMIVDKGGVSPTEAYRVFNMGFGMVWFVPVAESEKALEVCVANGVAAALCGAVVPGSGGVTLKF